jgi:hypothetical protein
MAAARNASCEAFFWTLALITGIGPWLLPAAIAIARPGRPFPLDVFSQVALAPRPFASALIAVHAVVYLAVVALLVLALTLYARNGATGFRQLVLATMGAAPAARLALRVAATSSSVAFVVALVLFLVR